MKRIHLIIAAVILAVTLVALLIIAGSMPPANPSGVTDPSHFSEPTDPSTEPTDPSSEPTDPSTEPTEPSSEPTDPSTEPTELSQPQSQPTDPNVEYIGSLYTRQELEAMENNGQGYGPGKTSNGNRAPYAVDNQKKYGKYGGNFIGPDNNCIYLTFDCGYEHENITADILDTLKEKNVKAVFFITMSYAKSNPELVQRMIDEGHVVGNHSKTHPVMPSLTIDKMVDEVMSLHNYILEHFGYEMTLFRPPTGEFSTRSLAVVQSLGYKNVHWSFAYADWEPEDQPELDYAYERITSHHHSGAIYLLHAVSRTNATVLGDAIDFFIAQGYSIELFQ